MTAADERGVSFRLIFSGFIGQELACFSAHRRDGFCSFQLQLSTDLGNRSRLLVRHVLGSSGGNLSFLFFASLLLFGFSRAVFLVGGTDAFGCVCTVGCVCVGAPLCFFTLHICLQMLLIFVDD